MTSREDVLDAVSDERDHQDRKWTGGVHQIPAWILIMEAKLEEAKKEWKEGHEPKSIQAIVEIAAVAVACVEMHGNCLMIHPH